MTITPAQHEKNIQSAEALKNAQPGTPQWHALDIVWNRFYELKPVENPTRHIKLIKGTYSYHAAILRTIREYEVQVLYFDEEGNPMPEAPPEQIDEISHYVQEFCDRYGFTII